MLRSLQWQNDIYKAYLKHSLKITISFREKYKAFIKKSVLSLNFKKSLSLLEHFISTSKFDSVVILRKRHIS